jgi:hypothetical protein
VVGVTYLHGHARARLANDLRGAYERGHTIQALANLTGRSYGYTRRLLLEAGTTLRPKGHQKEVTP